VGNVKIVNFSERLFNLLLLQILALKAEALLKLCRPEDAEMVITSAQKVETALRKATGMLTDTTILIVQVQIDMALGRYYSVSSIFLPNVLSCCLSLFFEIS
jgi:vacuolar-type H+-ATPase subunit C/Vma6